MACHYSLKQPSTNVPQKENITHSQQNWVEEKNDAYGQENASCCYQDDSNLPIISKEIIDCG